MAPRRMSNAWREVRWGRAALVLAAGGLLMWLTLALTMGMVFGRTAPEVAYRWWPYSADAQAGIAAALVRAEATPANVERALRLSENALRREPTNVPASRTLGLVAFIQGQPSRAGRLFNYSESLSRRDVPTQLWLIEQNVNRNDIAGALLHYDRALRTSIQIRELLFPILVRASADPSTAPSLARLVGTRPNWWQAFAEQLFESSESSHAILLALDRLRLRADNEDELELIGAAIRRLVDLGDYPAAFRVYLAVQSGGSADRLALRNGSFEEDGQLPPFDWEFRSEPGLSAYPQAREGADGRRVMFISGESGRGGYVARQLLLLRPGTYRIAATVGDVPPDTDARPRATVICAGTPATQLMRMRFPRATGGGNRLSGEFTVPATACPAQWLWIEAGSSLDSVAITPWIDSIRVRAL